MYTVKHGCIATLTTNNILLVVSGISTEIKRSSHVIGVAGSNSDKVKSLLFDKNLTYSILNVGGLQLMTISEEQFVLEKNKTNSEPYYTHHTYYLIFFCKNPHYITTKV